MKALFLCLALSPLSIVASTITIDNMQTNDFYMSSYNYAYTVQPGVHVYPQTDLLHEAIEENVGDVDYDHDYVIYVNQHTGPDGEPPIGIILEVATNSPFIMNYESPVVNPLDETRMTTTAINGLLYGFAFCVLLAGWWSVKGVWKAFLGGDTAPD